MAASTLTTGCWPRGDSRPRPLLPSALSQRRCHPRAPVGVHHHHVLTRLPAAWSHTPPRLVPRGPHPPRRRSSHAMQTPRRHRCGVRQPQHACCHHSRLQYRHGRRCHRRHCSFLSCRAPCSAAAPRRARQPRRRREPTPSQCSAARRTRGTPTCRSWSAPVPQSGGRPHTAAPRTPWLPMTGWWRWWCEGRRGRRSEHS